MELNRKSTSLPFHHFAQWAHNCPGQIALIEYESGRQLMYGQLARKVDITTFRLLELGIEVGDRVAVNMPFSIEYVCLMLATWRIGAIFAPMNAKLDLGMQIDQLALIEPKIYIFNQPLPLHTQKYLKSNCQYIRHYVNIDDSSFNPDQPYFSDICKASRIGYRFIQQRYHFRLKRAIKEQHLWSPALIIFKEDATDEAVLLSQDNLLHQIKNNQSLFGLGPYDKVLVSLPSWHVGGIITSLLSTITNGGTAVLCANFEPSKSKTAIARHYISHLLQYSYEYQELWEQLELAQFDNSSLRFSALVDGAPDLTFLSKMDRFSPESGLGFFIPEAGGFVSFCTTNHSIRTYSQHLGMEIPNFSQLSIREALTYDKKAGDPIPEGFMGEVCVQSPSVFLGYYNNPKATSKALCKEGILYTGYQGILSLNHGQSLLSIASKDIHSKISMLTA